MNNKQNIIVNNLPSCTEGEGGGYIVFATNNQHKLSEIRQILGDSIKVLSLNDIYDHYHVDVFADDTGLEVEALNGAPGVYSARYAAVGCPATSSQPKDHDSEANMTRLLHELGENNNRRARFRTVIALIQQGQVHEFEGIVNGQIIRERRGGEGFGYDPIFQPDGYDQTFAELGLDIKNQISHRARATAKLADYLLNK